jgi:hypothetical protein
MKTNFPTDYLLIILLGILVTGCGHHENPSALNNPNGRNDSWGYSGPGGGGAMFNPFGMGKSHSWTIFTG